MSTSSRPTLPVTETRFTPSCTNKAASVGGLSFEKPVVPQGLQIRALATGLQHPRSLYALPNGDVLVVEANGPKAPINRPKDLIMGWVQSFAGAKAKGGNRITLLRGVDGNGEPQRNVFLDHLNSPFGVALIGQNLYVANTDAIVRYPYTDGQTAITAEGTKLTDLPGGPIDHHWTKSLLASPDGSKLYVGVGSNSNITENGIQADMSARRSGRLTSKWVLIASSPAVFVIPPASSGSRRAENSGPSPTSAMNSAQIWCRTI
jgi:glucose/arabinose dehydrogenase